MLADFEEAVAELVPAASAARYEEALANLGTYLGFEAERPEKIHGTGPDVLWRTGATFDFVIEAKSKKEDNPFTRATMLNCSKQRTGSREHTQDALPCASQPCPKRSPTTRRAQQGAMRYAWQRSPN
uniref:Uncharacterized protein n=1 Tax=Phenylobacterium glaciei TaxID=2803784 RepID=A0A974P359_9CAUL|nr:hypothetical protein JKL49_26135 [Phenylobacterium glaciei]